MSASEVDYDAFAGIKFKLDMVNINTPDGDFGFLLGTDGRFTDVNGKLWIGSTLFGSSDIESAINGIAPAGQISMAFFQDPDAPDLIGEIKALGVDYVKGRALTYYVQPLASHSELSAPKLAPVLLETRIMKSLIYNANGALDRSITVTFETPHEFRVSARRLICNTEDHARLIGHANPSLEFWPSDSEVDEKLFG